MNTISDTTLLQHKHLYGLIGYPLSHSFSKSYFAQKFENEGITNSYYETFPIEKIESFLTTLRSYPNLKGLNVTIPYKESVIGYLNYLDESARAVGAVNCIKIEQGFLIGHNTDVYGFEKALVELLSKNKAKPQQALILGTGGAAKAVAFVLKKLEIRFTFVSRQSTHNQLTYSDLTSLDHYSLIINTTPLGMSPQVDAFPAIPYPCLNENHLLFDLIYNPEQTLFLQKGAAQGAATQNGLSMLYYQAEKAWEIWQADTDAPFLKRLN